MQKINNQFIYIRQATFDDIQYIAQIEVDNQHIDEHSHPTERMMNELFLREYRKRWKKKLSEGMCTLIVSANDNTVGFISYSTCDEVLPGTDHVAEINNIYVLPEMRGRLIGKLLCETALEKIRKAQFKQVMVWLLAGSHRTMQFYEAMGFLPTSAVRLDKIRENVILKEFQYQILLEST
jgi:L-amino acid N-acyltransferase YncA